METMDVMNNEEVIETAETVVKASSGKHFIFVVGIGLIAFATYKYVIKPMVITKIRLKNERQMIEVKRENRDDADTGESSEV